MASINTFSVDQYHRIIEAGALNKDDRVELLEGWIVSKMPHNPPHDGTIDILVGEFQPMLPATWFPRVQSAITTADSEPEPDIAIVRGPRYRYFGKHPHAADIGLVVEISESTLHDRNFKAAIFARAGIVTYWIVNLLDSRIEVHTLPVEAGYQAVRNYAMDELLPVILDGQEIGTIAVSTLFAK